MKQYSEIELLNKWSDFKSPLVSICTLTYNHENFIEETLKSFFIQNTSFPFEILIHDDASKDKTKKIIKKYEKLYPSIIKPIYQTVNQKSKYKRGMNPRFNFPRAKGKYIAICDGDDYWTDPYKLQKQVDFLENNKDFVLCGTQFSILNPMNILKKQKTAFAKGSRITLKMIVLVNPFGTLTVCFKREALSTKFFENINKYSIGDWPLYFYLLHQGDGYILYDRTAVYREHEGGIFSSQSAINQNRIEFNTITNFYNENKKLFTNDIKLILQKKIWKVLLYNNRRVRIDFLKKYGAALEFSDLKRKIIYLTLLLPKFFYSRITWRLFKILK